MEILALIPARGGSQGLPRKNIALVGGKPMLSWSIAAAKESGIIGRVVVSTDDEEIASCARAHGAEVPFLRPAEIATATATAMDVLLHTIRWLEEKEGYKPNCILLLQPTSPLRTAEDIRAAFRLMQEKKANGVVGVTPVNQHPDWLYYVEEGRKMRPYLEAEKRANKQRQSLPPLFCSNGAIYYLDREAVLREKSWFPEPTVAYEMPPERSVDIDTAYDLRIADLLLRQREGLLS